LSSYVTRFFDLDSSELADLRPVLRPKDLVFFEQFHHTRGWCLVGYVTIGGIGTDLKRPATNPVILIHRDGLRQVLPIPENGFLHTLVHGNTITLNGRWSTLGNAPAAYLKALIDERTAP
jgi:hypothetical protein